MNLLHIPENAMSQRLSMIALLGTVSLTAACGSDPSAAGTAGTGGTAGTSGAAGTVGTAGTGGTSGPEDAGGHVAYGPCQIGENGSCSPTGFPFTQFTFAHSNSCMGLCAATPDAYGFGKPPQPGTTIRLSQPETGKLCMSGTNVQDAGFFLVFTMISTDMLGVDYQKVWKRFNAEQLGITQVRFTIDTPPPGGINVSVTTLHADVCTATRMCGWQFALPNPVTESGTTTASFVDLTSVPSQTFDARALDSIGFDMGAGDFDFCIHDFQFLDINGVEVKEVKP
jgi:hypothetical protein